MDEATTPGSSRCGRCDTPIFWDDSPDPLCNDCRATVQAARLRRALATMSDVNQWLGKHDGHVEAVKLGQAMRDVRWVLVGLEGRQDEDASASS